MDLVSDTGKHLSKGGQKTVILFVKKFAVLTLVFVLHRNKNETFKNEPPQNLGQELESRSLSQSLLLELFPFV